MGTHPRRRDANDVGITERIDGVGGQHDEIVKLDIARSRDARPQCQLEQRVARYRIAATGLSNAIDRPRPGVRVGRDVRRKINQIPGVGADRVGRRDEGSLTDFQLLSSGVVPHREVGRGVVMLSEERNIRRRQRRVEPKTKPVSGLSSEVQVGAIPQIAGTRSWVDPQ